MKTITIKTVDGNEIIIRQVEDITIEEEKMFDYKQNDKYYYIDERGKVADTYYISGNVWDKGRKAYGNMFKNKEPAEETSKIIKLYLNLKEFARIVNEGWEPSIITDFKYVCKFDQIRDEWVVSDETFHSKHLFEVYFKSKELAERAIYEVIIPITGNHNYYKGEL